MAMNSAHALYAKLQSDKAAAMSFNADPEKYFMDFVKKHGYNVTYEEFKSVAKEHMETGAMKAPGRMQDENPDSGKVGLSIVGVDYAFTTAKTASS